MSNYMYFSLGYFKRVVLLCGMVGMCIAMSCTGKSSETQKMQQDLKKEVISIHDEVMPKMREIGELKEQLDAIEDKFVESNNEEVTQKVSELRKIVGQLEEAEHAMRDWMQDFKISFPEETPSSEVVEYYEAEKAKIESVKVSMNTSIDTAESFIESNKE